jgi:hypothetical protein
MISDKNNYHENFIIKNVPNFKSEKNYQREVGHEDIKKELPKKRIIPGTVFPRIYFPYSLLSPFFKPI